MTQFIAMYLIRLKLRTAFVLTQLLYRVLSTTVSYYGGSICLWRQSWNLTTGHMDLILTIRLRPRS